MMKRVWALVLACAMLMTAQAWAEAPEIVSEPVESAIEEQGDLELDGAPEAEATQAEDFTAQEVFYAAAQAARTLALTGKDSISVNIGDTLQLSVPGKTVKSYKSGKAKVATVTDTGLVTAVKEGSAKITVTCTDRKKYKLTVKVVDPYKPTAVKLEAGGSVTLKVGQTLQLNAKVLPEGARRNLTWKSGKTKVATVDANGIVKGIAAGKAKITVTTDNKKKATLTVTVEEDAAGGGLGLSASRKKYFRKYMSESELNQTIQFVEPYLEQLKDLSLENQVAGCWYLVGQIYYNYVDYSMSAKHYKDPYGLFILHVASCAGTSRAVGFCLNLLGIPYKHINENKYSHQWTQVLVNGEYWIVDPMGYCGPESGAWDVYR